jgi:thiol:disulfide interchange protein DsbD
MLNNGDTLALLKLPTYLLRRSILIVGVVACIVSLCLPLQSAQALEDPFGAPLKSLNKIDPANVVQFRLVELTKQDAGTSAVLELNTRGGFKIYEKGLRFEYKSAATLNAPITLQTKADPEAKVVQDPFYNEPRAIFDKGTRFTATSDIAMDETGVLRVRFEACSVNTCLLPAYFLVDARKGEVSRPEPKNTLAGLSVGSSSGATNASAPDVGLAPKAAVSLGTPAAAATPAAPLSPAAEPAAVQSATPLPSATATPSPTPKPTTPAPEVSLTDSITAQVQLALGQRSWFLFPALFLAGLLMNLTPCVYPMIPITLNVLSQTKKSEDDSQATQSFFPALVYVIGVILAYASMGVIAGMTGSLFGGILQSRAFNLGLAALMFLLGLSMLGSIDLSRLQSLGNRIPLSKRSPNLAILTMGAVSGLVAAPCTGPVLSLLLVLVGQTKDPIYGFTLMSVFAAGFGAPYLVLGMLSHHFKKLPRAGKLTGLVKNVFAALMFALSLYYLKIFLGQYPLFALLYAQPTLTGVVTISLLTVVFLIWQYRSANHPITLLGTQIGLTILALWMTLSLVKGFVPMTLPSWPSLNRIGDPVEVPPAGSLQKDNIQWHKDWRKAVQAAQLEKKGLLVDAWAQWCAACLKMDAEVWSESGVEALINQHFIALKIDFTESNPASEELTERWELTGLPAVGIYPAGSDFNGKPPILFREAVTVSQFHQAVQKLFNGEIKPTK